MKRKYIWLIEIIIWTLVVAIGLGFFIYNTSIKNNVNNIFYIFTDDAGGLVQGSPVRLMGITIGYIRDVKIFDNKVFVSFLITEKNVTLPQKAEAIIEFYGLGGSTSLELYPLDTDDLNDKQIIAPVSSYRVQDFWNGQVAVANVLIGIYGGIGRNIDKTDILNNKHLLKQSALVQNVTNATEQSVTSQSVIIYKLTEQTYKYIEDKKNKDLQNIQSETEEQTNE